MNRHTEQMVDEKVVEIFTVYGNTQKAWQTVYDTIGEIGIEFAMYRYDKPSNVYIKTREVL